METAIAAEMIYHGSTPSLQRQIQVCSSHVCGLQVGSHTHLKYFDIRMHTPLAMVVSCVLNVGHLQGTCVSQRHGLLLLALRINVALHARIRDGKSTDCMKCKRKDADCGIKSSILLQMRTKEVQEGIEEWLSQALGMKCWLSAS